MNTLWKTFARMAVGQFYVFQPMASRYRFKKVIKCPETDERAEILVNAYPSTTSKAGKKPSIRNCSLWPRRKGCTQGCLDQATKG